MDGYDVVLCANCGFVYSDNIPSQKEFNGYYAAMSKYEFNYDDGIVSENYTEHFEKIVKFVSPYMSDKNAKILDIGCSTGGLLALFKEHGYSNLLGLDPSSTCAASVKRLYGVDAVAGNISDFYSKETFDLVILSAVLEHLVDFMPAMNKIRALLKDNGLLFIEIPDAERFDSYIFTPFQQFSIEHINYFSQYSIVNLLSSAFFNIVKVLKDENRVNQTVDPDLFILSSKSIEQDFAIVRDEACGPCLRNYIDKCRKMDLEIKEKLKEKLKGKEKIIVWGVGTHTQRLIGSGLDLSRILYFVDSNSRYSGKKINNVEIRLPKDIKDDIPILISTYSYQDEVARQIKEKLKLPNEIITLY